ncbi:YbfB/YjiJ family MFS transporter [Streptomyces morookaense]|uniref:YbfB/YjiJ family MFS transporter n=1 Tax=Streptomyces morookaense TaxID=1970 RepID=UPI0033E02563
MLHSIPVGAFDDGGVGHVLVDQSGRTDGTTKKTRQRRQDDASQPTQRKLRITERRAVLQGALAMAVAMGVGRFVFTPILPMMEHQTHVTASDGASIATANYLGYLLGALAAGFIPPLIRSRAVLPVCLAVLVATLAAMPLTTALPLWVALRFLAGAASALVFVGTARSAQAGLRHRPRLIGWVYGGVGLGIAVTGLAVLLIHQSGTWRQAWWVAAALSAVTALFIARAPAEEAAPAAARTAPPQRPARGSLGWLAVSYFLEGVGYIVAATFLVAALSADGSPSWLGTGAWVIVGLAAFPSCVLWMALSLRVPRPLLLTVALLVQAMAVALPSVLGGTGAAVVSAVGFGGTFMAITQLSLVTGTALGTPRTVALLTAGYGLGQVAGPLVVQPVLSHGYRPALAISGGVLLAAALCAAPLMRRAADPAHA